MSSAFASLAPPHFLTCPVVGGGGRSLKAQLRHADALGARYVAILGERELAQGEVTLRDLRDGQQRSVAEADVAQALGIT